MSGVVVLAAGVDLVAIGIVIVFIIIPLIGVVASKMREIVQPGPMLPPERGDSSRIQEQIDEFLRRASQRRGGQPVPEEPEPAAAEREDDAQVGGRVNKQVQSYLDNSEFRRRSEQLGGEVAQADQQFNQQVGQAFTEDVSRLALRGGEAADPVEVADAESAVPDDKSRPTLEALPVAGSGLGELLGSRENIVQAIIMNEILRRPEW